MYKTIEQAYEAFQEEASIDKDVKLGFLAGAIAAAAVLTPQFPPELGIFSLKLINTCQSECDKLMNE